MELDWLELILLALTASVKYAIFVPITIVTQKLGFFEALIFAQASGTFGVLLFTYLSKWLLAGWNWIKTKIGLRKNKRKRKIFSKRNRTIVRLKAKYGLPGIALFTPILLSIPIGSFIAVRYYKNKKRVLLFLLSGVLFWSLVFAMFAGTIKAFLESLNLA